MLRPHFFLVGNFFEDASGDKGRGAHLGKEQPNFFPGGSFSDERAVGGALDCHHARLHRSASGTGERHRLALAHDARFYPASNNRAAFRQRIDLLNDKTHAR